MQASFLKADEIDPDYSPVNLILGFYKDMEQIQKTIEVLPLGIKL